MNKKKKIILAVIIVVVIVAVCNWAFNYIIDNLPANIHLRDNSIDEEENLIIFKNGNRWCWDTGSSSSLLFRDIEHKKLRVGYSWNIDSEHTKRIDTLFFAKTLSTDSILLKNFIYSYIEKSNISHSIQDLNIIGILGMNVIKNYNWLLDFDKNILQNYDKDFQINTSPKFVISYIYSNRCPFTNIQIGYFFKVKKMLLDSGFYGDIMLYDSDIEVINKFITPDTIINDTSNSLYSDSIPVKRYVYYDVYINDLLFEKLTINEGKKRLIGTGFFRKFDRVFWDSGNREVRFYKD